MIASAEDLTHEFQETNRRLRLWLDGLAVSRSGPQVVSHAASPQEMSGMLSELMQAGALLRTLPEPADALLEKELNEYRSLVDRLRAMMPSIHDALLREKARIEQERCRVVSAAEWARVSRQTL